MSEFDAKVPVPKPSRGNPLSAEDGSVSPSGIYDLLGGTPSPVTRSDLRNWQPPSVEALQLALPQYEIKTFVARGGMGAVYCGRQKALDREVAIKIMPPDIEGADFQFAERFKTEAKAMAKLSHPNIVAVHDAGETSDGLLFFVMDFVEGADVQQLIAKDGKLEPQRALAITAAVLDALEFAHESGIIHRDIKPSNIMLDAKGRVKVADFGLAKSLAAESDGFTGSEVMLGTADFIAPEAAIKGIKLDARADIYAVGVMLYVMLTGKIPRGRFEMPTAVLPKIDPRLDAIVDKAMQTDREKRYSSAGEMKTAVANVIAEKRAGAMPRPKSPLVPVIVSAVVIVVTAAAFFVFKQPAPFMKPDASAKPGTWRAAEVPESHAVETLALPKSTDPAARTKSGDAITKTPASMPAASQEKWVDRLQEWFAYPHPSLTRLTKLPDGTVRVEEKHGIIILLVPVRDAAVRAVIRDLKGNFALTLRSNGATVENLTQAYHAAIGPLGDHLTLGFHRPGSGELVTLAKVPLLNFDPKATHTLEFRAVGDRLTVLLDGKQMVEKHDSTYALGTSALTTEPGTIVEKLDYLMLDK